MEAFGRYFGIRNWKKKWRGLMIVLAGVALALAFLWVRQSTSRVTEATCTLIVEGMSIGEVEALLRVSPQSYRKMLISGVEARCWTGDDGKIIVWFDENDTVKEKVWSVTFQEIPDPLPTRIRRSLVRIARSLLN